MARIELQCVCGFFFAVADHQLDKARCPSCGKAATAPVAAPAARAALDPKILKLLIGGGVGLVLVVGLIVAVILMSRSSENPYEKELERSEQKKQKKTSREIADAPALPGAAPKAGPSNTIPLTVTVKTPLTTPVKPGTVTPVKAPVAAKTAPPALRNPLSAELSRRLKDEIFTLNAFYLGSVLEGYSQERFAQLSTGVLATDEEASQVVNLLSGPRAKAARDDQSKILEGYASAEKDAFESVPVDRVKMKDGRVVQCRVVEETETVVKVERRLASGVGGFMNFSREEVSQIEKGKGIGSEWPGRWELALKSPPAQQQAIYEWCKTNSLAGQAKLVALLMLKGDPSLRKARDEAGLPPDPVRYGEEMARGGIIVHQGRNWGAKELKDKLLKDGYSILDGKWYGKKEKMISVPGLFKYERQAEQPVQISSSTAPLSHEEDIAYKMALDPASGAFQETAEVRLLRRFYAPPLSVSQSASLKKAGYNLPADTPEIHYQLLIDLPNPPALTPIQGEVFITVPLGAPILEASVMTLAEVRAGGTITVFLLNGEGEPRTRLYNCSGKEDGTHKLPESVKGRTQIDLAVVIHSQADYGTKTERRRVSPLKRVKNVILEQAVDIVHYRLIPEYKAVLFPSTSNTFEVFRLKAQVAESVPLYDKLFEQCPELLKDEVKEPPK